MRRLCERRARLLVFHSDHARLSDGPVALTAQDGVSQNRLVMFLTARGVQGAQSCCKRAGAFGRAVVIVLFAAPALFALAVSAAGSARGEDHGLRAVDGDKPGFSLADLSGQSVTLADFSGRAVLVHFFATWCEPCREELPALQRLATRDRDVTVVAIAVADTPLRVKRLLAQVPVEFPILLDADRAAARAWGVTTLPTSFFFSADQATRLVVEQEYDWDRFDPARERRHTEGTQ